MSFFPVGDNERLLPILSSRQIELDNTRKTREPSSLAQVAETKEVVTQRSEKIFSSWNTLNGILKRHEPTIRNRWMKKSKEKRLNHLREAYPNLPSRHRPDIEAMRKQSLGMATNKATQRNAYLRPYINADDLSRNRSMLLFLHSRGRNQPAMFAQSDFHHAKIGIQIADTASVHLDGFVLWLGGDKAGLYGNCLPEFDGMPSDNHKVFRSGDGLLVLEIQEGIYQFLVQWCYAILHDMDSSSLITDIFPIESQVLGVPNDSESLAVENMFRDNPYRLPSALDFQKLQMITSAKRADAADHVFALREDPEYFRETVQQFSEHCVENILDIAGNPDSTLGSTPFWDKIISYAIFEAYAQLAVWTEIDIQVGNVAGFQNLYAAVIDPSKKLPELYRKAFLELQYFLERTTIGSWYNLEKGVRSSPNLRSHWVRQSSTIQFRDPESSKKDPLLWIFGTMWEDFKPHLVLPDLMDELETVTRSDKTQDNRLSAWVAGNLNEIGLMVKLRRELTTYWPWAYPMQKTDFDKWEEEFKEYYKVFENQLLELLTLCIGLSCAKLGTPSAKLFEYPSGKRRTRKVVEMMRNAEKNLDTFWDSIDGQVKKRIGESLEQHMEPYFRKYESSRERTQEWIEPPKKENWKPAGKQMGATESVEFRIPLTSQDSNAPVKPARSTSLIDEATEAKLSLSSQVPTASAGLSKRFVLEEKVKTKGTARPKNPEELPIANLELTTPTPTFKVPSKVYEVFSTIFFVPTTHSKPGELEWEKFSDAMKYIGFQTQQASGSAHHFSPPESLKVSGINFHEPHPGSKLTYHKARCFGRRLTRRYGWTGATFEEI